MTRQRLTIFLAGAALTLLAAPGGAASAAAPAPAPDGAVKGQLAPGFHAVVCGVVGSGATKVAAVEACAKAVKANRHVSQKRCRCDRADVVETKAADAPAFYLSGWWHRGATPAAAVAACRAEERRLAGERGQGVDDALDVQACETELHAVWGPFERRKARSGFDDERVYRWLTDEGQWVDARGGGPCFPAGTQVLTPDGARPIEALKVGDRVVSWPAESVTGRDLKTARDVTARVARVKERFADEVLTIALGEGRTLRATPNHPIYSATRGGFVVAGELTVDEKVVVRGEDGAPAELAVTKVDKEAGPIAVYDITVDPTHTYFAEGVWVHNY